MEKDFVFSSYKGESECVIINRIDVYLLGAWADDCWRKCSKLNEDGAVVGFVNIRPVMKGDKILGVVIQ